MNKMIPSEIIHADKDGNAAIGKNLEIDDTTKLNGGLEPIHTYSLGDYTFSVLFERHIESSTDHVFFGYIVFDDGSSSPCIGIYSLSNTDATVNSFNAISNSSIYSLNGSGTVVEKTIATNP